MCNQVLPRATESHVQQVPGRNAYQCKTQARYEGQSTLPVARNSNEVRRARQIQLEINLVL